MQTNLILDEDFNSDFDKKKIELISLNKFIILNFLTLGLYGIWWMYKAWRFFKERDGSDIMPVARTIFAIFYTYELFERILSYAKSNGHTEKYSSGGLFALFFVLNFSARLPDPYGFISILAFTALIQPFNALNFAIANSTKFNGIEQVGFNTRQIILIVIGGILWALMLLGYFLPDEWA